MMFLFPKQQQKNCCEKDHAPAACELALFPCTMMACCQPLCALKKGCLCICAASRPSRCLCCNGKVRTRHLSCFFCSLLTLDTCIAGKMCDALDQTEDAQTTSILTVLRNLRFAGIVSCWGVEHRCRLLCPLKSPVRISLLQLPGLAR